MSFDLIDKKFGRKPETEPEYCRECENGGWVQVYSPRPPAFAECPKCFNPEDLPSP